MTLKYILFVLLALNSLACANVISSQSQTVETEKKVIVEDSSDADQYAVYDALIKDLSKDTFEDFSSLVIIDHTNIDYRENPKLTNVLPNVQETLLSLTAEMIEDFRAKNKTRVLLKDSFNLPAKRVFISGEELKAVLKENLDWNAFHKKYQNSQGAMTLSNVGFDKDMKKAFVYVANTRGSLDGFGLYVVLEKKDGRWQVKEKFASWMS